MLKQSFMTRGSPIKFSLDTSEKIALKDVELDPDFDEPQEKRFSIARITLRVLGLAMWLLLIAAYLYMYRSLNSYLI